MKRRGKNITGILLATTLLIALSVYLSQAEPVKVLLAVVAQGQVNSTVANTRAGTVDACNRARLSPAIGGQIAKLPVREGQQIKAGQLLLELWNDDLAAEVELSRSEAQASAARAREACITADVSYREAQRLKKLQKRKLASEEAAESAEGLAKARRAGCDAAKATAQVSKARIDAATARLERTRLYAPFAGTVAEINGEIGEYVTPSPVGVATLPTIDLIDNTCLYIKAPIDEVDAPAIRTGMPAWISLDAFPKQNFNGKVRRIAPYVLDREKQARTVDIEVDFLAPDAIPNLLAGYSADVEVILGTHQKTLRIPTEALLEGDQVLVYQADSRTLEQRKVSTGLKNWKYTEVLEGLQAGEQIVTSVDREGVTAGAHVSAESSAEPDQSP